MNFIVLHSSYLTEETCKTIYRNLLDLLKNDTILFSCKQEKNKTSRDSPTGRKVSLSEAEQKMVTSRVYHALKGILLTLNQCTNEYLFKTSHYNIGTNQYKNLSSPYIDFIVNNGSSMIEIARRRSAEKFEKIAAEKARKAALKNAGKQISSKEEENPKE